MYAEDINMLEGMDDEELQAYLKEHPRIIALFEIDVIGSAADYATHTSVHAATHEPDPASIMELSKGQEAFEERWRSPEESWPRHWRKLI